MRTAHSQCVYVGLALDGLWHRHINSLNMVMEFCLEPNVCSAFESLFLRLSLIRLDGISIVSASLSVFKTFVSLVVGWFFFHLSSASSIVYVVWMLCC